MILFDGVHLVSNDSLDELHRFARKIGLKRSWFQKNGIKGIPHYDVTSQRIRNRCYQEATQVHTKGLVSEAVKSINETSQ